MGLHFTALPTSAAEISLELVQPADPSTHSWATRLLQAIRQELPALHLYLEQAAAAAWQQVTDFQIDVNGRPLPLQLAPSTILREEGVQYTTGEAIMVELARLSPLACQLTVRLYSDNPAAVAGRSITMRAPYETWTATTDDQGIAHFAPIPIAALLHLTGQVYQ